MQCAAKKFIYKLTDIIEIRSNYAVLFVSQSIDIETRLPGSLRTTLTMKMFGLVTLKTQKKMSYSHSFSDENIASFSGSSHDARHAQHSVRAAFIDPAVKGNG